jgi:AraC-like DNA-binding protein
MHTTTMLPKDAIVCKHIPLFGGFELLQATYYRQRFSRHTHAGYAFGIITNGQLDFSYRHQSWHALPGDINLVVPGEAHDGQAKDATGWSYRMLYLPASILQNAAYQLTEHDQMPWFLPGSIEHSPLASSLAVLHSCLADTAADSLQQESALLYWLTNFICYYGDLKKCKYPVGQEPAAISRIIDYLHTKYAETIPLQKLATIAGLSPYHLLRAFEKSTGLPPHLYQQQLRIQKAKTLLAQGHPPAIVALSTGFYDQSHLTRQFKKITGLTPVGYQKTIL